MDDAMADAIREIEREKVKSEMQAALADIQVSLDAWDRDKPGDVPMRERFQGKRKAIRDLAERLGIAF